MKVPAARVTVIVPCFDDRPLVRDAVTSIQESEPVESHAGEGLVTYQRRLHGRRKLHGGRRRHRELYGKLRDAHPELFNSLREHRRASDLSLSRKLFYPVIYGRRRRFWFEPRAMSMLDMLGIWTLRR